MIPSTSSEKEVRTPAVFVGNLWKEALRPGSFERGKLELSCVEGEHTCLGGPAKVSLTWYSHTLFVDQSLLDDARYGLETDRKCGNAGRIGMCENQLIVDIDPDCNTKFRLRSVRPWKSCTLLGAVGHQVFYFRTEGSEHTRDAWVEAITKYISYANSVCHDEQCDFSMIGRTGGQAGFVPAFPGDDSQPSSKFGLDYCYPNCGPTYRPPQLSPTFFLLPPPTPSALVNSDPQDPRGVDQAGDGLGKCWPVSNHSNAVGGKFSDWFSAQLSNSNLSPYPDLANEEICQWNTSQILRCLDIGSPSAMDGTFSSLVDKIRAVLRSLLHRNSSMSNKAGLLMYLAVREEQDQDSGGRRNLTIHFSIPNASIRDEWITGINEVCCAGGATGFVQNHSVVLNGDRVTISASLQDGDDPIESIRLSRQAQLFDHALLAGGDNPSPGSFKAAAGLAELINGVGQQTMPITIDVSRDSWFENLLQLFYICNDVYAEFVDTLAN